MATILTTYNDARALGGWTTECLRSPLPRAPWRHALNQDEAIRQGYQPRPRKDLTDYVLVPTSLTRGFRGVSARTYYSVWGRAASC